MDSQEQLRLIREANGDPALLALTTVDLTFPGLPGPDRAALRAALTAAAVPHWCDADILAQLTGVPGSSAAEQWELLRKLSVVEPFPARGATAGNVHEASRLAIRAHLAGTQQARLAELSERAAGIFEAHRQPAGQIEWLYHLLVADPERGTAQAQDLYRAWEASAHHEDLAALAAALTELDNSRLLRGKALVAARLIISWQDFDFSGAASLYDRARQLLQAAEALEDDSLAGDAYCLVGDTARDRGDAVAAAAAYAQYLARFERLAQRDPANAGWQRELAVAHSRIGELAHDRDDLAAAADAFAQDLAISQRLALLDPDNLSRQRDLAVASSRVGDVARAQADAVAAAAAYGRYLAISRRLVQRDPDNAGWQRELAAAYCKIGELAQDRGDLAAAADSYAQDLAISQRLVQLDPDNAGWQRDLAATYSKIGELAQEQGDLAAAADSYARDLAILERLAQLDPTNASWQQDLATARSRVADLARWRRP